MGEDAATAIFPLALARLRVVSADSAPFARRGFAPMGFRAVWDFALSGISRRSGVRAVCDLRSLGVGIDTARSRM